MPVYALMALVTSSMAEYSLFKGVVLIGASVVDEVICSIKYEC